LFRFTIMYVFLEHIVVCLCETINDDDYEDDDDVGWPPRSKPLS